MTASQPPRVVGGDPTLADIARSREKHIYLDNYLDIGQPHLSLYKIEIQTSDLFIIQFPISGTSHDREFSF